MKTSTLTQSIDHLDIFSLNEAEQALFARIRQSRITDATPIKRLKPIVTVGGCVFARRGDFSVITGQKKAGKTTVLQFVVATALLDAAPAELDTLQILAEPCKGKDVIYVDTEGSHEDTQDFINGVKKIMGIDEQPDNFHAYHLREFSQVECNQGVNLLFKQHPNAHLWIIDGIADLVSKPNDEEESNKTVRWIMSAAGRLDTCFILVIHENQTQAGRDPKLRGHLGSELERKASGAIGIEKDRAKGEHYIKSRFLRKSADFEPIAFRFDKLIGRPVSRLMSLEERQEMEDRGYQRTKELTALRDKCFNGFTSLTKDQLKDRITYYQEKSPSNEAARKKCIRNLKAMEERSIITSEGDDKESRYYPINEKGEAIRFKVEHSDERTPA